MAVRSVIARRKRASVSGIWPVAPGTEQKPEGWPGWPEGKQFAFVLTHDVEGGKGLAKCRKLAALEARLGFRSSFNLIPEGSYHAPAQLRSDLRDQGFEVGVHDLRHDGKLYRRRGEFAQNAERINKYVKEWGAEGFRSGFMLHNLDWLHDLNIQYDASTFDTDPFEPQPDAAGTIFPFWKSNGNGNGYVELPYTLPQDSTLFLLLGERTPDVWLRKLDWVAQQGGMALVNVHPDYIRFPDEPQDSGTYPVELYEALLTYVRERYDASAWFVLPKEVARFARAAAPKPPRRPLRVCMVTYSYYLADARVTRYAEALAQRGDHVDVLSLRRWQDTEQAGPSAVNIVRIQSRIGKKEKTAVSYLLPVLRFLWTSTGWIIREHSRQPYDFFHIHNIPDFLVFAGAYPRLRGAHIILDIHDIVPEFYESKFGVGRKTFTIWALKVVERLSARFANHVIISNDLWREQYEKRTGSHGRCSVFINNVDDTIFRARPRTRQDGKFIVIFPGGLQWHQGLDIAIRAFQKVVAKLPNVEFHIYGDGNVKQELVELVEELGLTKSVLFFDPLPVRQIADVMANADLGVVPKRADSFGNEAYSTKIMDFMSLGVPVIVSRTKIDQFYFDDSVVRFFESGNVAALSEAMIELICDAAARKRLSENGRGYAATHSWETRKRDYLGLVDSLCDGGRASSH